MSPVNQLSILAFAAGALAVPSFRDYAAKHGHHGHHRFHSSAGSAASGSDAPFPYASANSTGLYGTTGTGPVVTVSPVAASDSVETYNNAASTSDCTTDVTVTTTQRTYVTVTSSEDATSSVEASATQDSSSANRGTSTITVQSTVYATPSSSVVESSFSASSSSAAAYTPSAYSSSVESSSSAEVSPVASSSEASTSSDIATVTYSQVEKHHWYSAPAYSAPASSSAAVSSAPAYTAPSSSAVSVSSTTSSAAATSSAASSTGGGGKRGLAYNDYKMTDCFMSSAHMGFAYNWGSDASGFEKGDSSINFIPTLWGTADEFTSVWSENAGNAIKNGSEYLFAFNEPDHEKQSNLSPEAAAEGWMTHMEPFAGQAKLCAPSVTNGGGAMGLTWLSNFLTACSSCTIDCVNIHWYDSYENTDYFKSHVQNATDISGGKPVYLTEFGTTDGDNTQVSDFLKDVMGWMDTNNNVLGYAYFMVSEGLLVSGNEPSPYGSTYATYSS